MKFDSDEFRKKVQEESLAYAKAPLVTIEDCYKALDVGLPNRKPCFEAVQRAYRSKLYHNDTSIHSMPPEELEYMSLMTAKVKKAYKRICFELGKNPEEGLTETEESLIAELDELLKCWSDHWCATPTLDIEHEYRNRIKALKEKSNSSSLCDEK